MQWRQFLGAAFLLLLSVVSGECCERVARTVPIKESTEYISTFDNIWEAARKGTVQDVEYFIKKGVDVNVKDDWYRTPLHEAASYNSDIEILKYLVSQGANINAKDDESYTPLHNSAACSKMEILKYLVYQGANVNAQDKWGRTPLDVANTKENRNFLRDVTEPMKTYISVYKSLHEAAERGTIRDVRYFFQKGVNVNTKTDDGDTPLHRAAESNSNVVVSYLVYSQADVNAKNNDDWTPLHLAAMYNADKIVLNDLISQGADVNARDQWGQTPLDVADSKEKKSILREAMESSKPIVEPTK